MENSEKGSQNSLQTQLIEQRETKESEGLSLSKDLSINRSERVNSAPEQNVKEIDDDEVKVEIVDENIQRQGHHISHYYEKKSPDSVKRRQFQSLNPTKQFRSILKSHKNNEDSFLITPRVDARGNEIKCKKKGEKPQHKITFHNQIEEVNVVENWKQYNTDMSTEPGCGCNLI